MARESINIGSGPDSGNGDYLRVAFGKTENNFVEIYNSFIMTTKLTVGNSTVNSSLSNSGVLYLGSATVNATVNSSAFYVVNATANLTLSDALYINTSTSSARFSVTDIYVGNSVANVLISGNSVTLGGVVANASSVTIGNSSVTSAPTVSVQNSTSQAVFGTRSLQVGNSTTAVVTSVTVQNLSSSYVINSVGSTATQGSNVNQVTTSLYYLANSTANVTVTPVSLNFNNGTTVVNTSGVYVNGSVINTSSFYVSNGSANVTLDVTGLAIRANGAGSISLGNNSVNATMNSSTIAYTDSAANTTISTSGIVVANGTIKTGNSTVNVTINSSSAVLTGNVLAGGVNAAVYTVGSSAEINATGIWTSYVSVSGNLAVNSIATFSNNVNVGGALYITGNVISNVVFTGTVGVGKTANSAQLEIVGGNTSHASVRMAPGILTSSQTNGAIEFDGMMFYGTPSVRGVVPTKQVYILDSARTGANTSNTATSMFGVSTSLPIGKHQYEIYFAISHEGATATGLQYAVNTSTGSVMTHSYEVFSYATTTNTMAELSTPQYISNYLANNISSMVTVTGNTAAVANTYNIMHIKGIIDITVAATGFQPYYSFTGAPSNSSIVPGSYISIWPIGNSSVNTAVGNWV